MVTDLIIIWKSYHADKMYSVKEVVRRRIVLYVID